MKKVHPDLLELRKSIDLLDQALICLLAERMRVVTKVGMFKRNHAIEPLDSVRWMQVLSSKRKLAIEHNLDPDLVANIFEHLHQHALKIERLA